MHTHMICPWTERAKKKKLWELWQTIFNFRFLTLLAIGGSLAGSLLCFLKGCGYVFESFNVHRFATGQILLKLVEAVGENFRIFIFGFCCFFFRTFPLLANQKETPFEIPFCCQSMCTRSSYTDHLQTCGGCW
jgi:hypothetical protein